FIVKGKKLVRKDLVDASTTPTSFINAPKVLIRRTIKRQRDKNKNLVIGNHPLRKPTARKPRGGGNLVYTREPEGYVRHGPSSLVLKKTLKPKKKRVCGFFTRYGKCPNATRCPFIHDPTRRAVCPRWLKGQCTKPNCRLSHTPNDHIMPHCVHFQRGKCTSNNCIYPHVRVSPDAPVCRAFATEGYCAKGLECDEKHLHVCPEFAETGKCSNANCRLPHVAKSQKQSGIIKLGSWMNPQYFYAQQAAKKEKRLRQQQQQLEQQQQQQQQKIQQLEGDHLSKEEKREKEEQDGFVRLFDDSDEDDGWSQFERNDQDSEDTSLLRFNEAEEEEEESSEEEEDQFEDALDSPDLSDEEVYEEVSDTEAMSEDDE
ncbi:Zinc finger CCCH domain-containing protein 7, partial [Choanephora cucurbitarum]